MPFQIYLRHFNLSGLVHLVIVLMSLRGPGVGHMGIHVILSQTGSLLEQQYLAVIQQSMWVCLFAASIAVTTHPGNLPPSLSQYTHKTLATFLA